MVRHGRLLAALLAASILGAACGGDDSSNSVTTATSEASTASTAESTASSDAASPSSGAGTTESQFPAERCEANRAAGTITFVTSFDYAAAATIIDVVAAEAQGYFDTVCLDVKLQAGFTTANVALLASGQAQMTSMGSFSEVAVANAADAGLVAVAVEGHTAIEALLIEKDSGITDLAGLKGAKIGSKGGVPYAIRAMLADAGVLDGDYEAIEVDFNPILLFETEIVALPVFKSNEPGQLDSQGYADQYLTFDPRDQGIPSSYGVFTTTREFADEHPTAVADFLRATLKGFEWAVENPEEAVAATLAKSDPNFFFSPEGETFRWEIERQLVQDSTTPGDPVGLLVAEEMAAEVAFLEQSGVIELGSVDVAASFDPSFMDEIIEGDRVIWVE